jgi:hypothetical protein
MAAVFRVLLGNVPPVLQRQDFSCAKLSLKEIGHDFYSRVFHSPAEEGKRGQQLLKCFMLITRFCQISPYARHPHHRRVHLLQFSGNAICCKGIYMGNNSSSQPLICPVAIDKFKRI